MTKAVKERFLKEKRLFRMHKGILRAADAIKAGISRKALYTMRDLKLIEALSRGVFRLTEAPPLSQPDLVTVNRRVPQGVICLISALAYHKLTTQIPHEVHVAVSRGIKRPPRVDYPPTKTYQFSQEAYNEGVETHDIDGERVRIYSVEKTLADTFKFRNKIGIDVFLESLKIWRGRRNRDLKALLKYSAINRVEKQIRPYLEAHQ